TGAVPTREELEAGVPAASNLKTSVSCAFCRSRSLEPVIDFGEVALAGGFIKPDRFAEEPRFPLRVFFCNDCYAVQVVDVVDAGQIADRYGSADLVVANNVYAHVPDIRGMTEGIRDLLKDDGVFIFEVHYLGKITQGMQYDMIYHEHLYYYSLLALINHFKRFGLTIFDVKPIQMHAGSMRYFVCRESSRYASTISPRVASLRNDEPVGGLNKAE